MGVWSRGDFSGDGKLVLLGEQGLQIWNSFPQDANDAPDLTVTSMSPSATATGA